MKYIFTCQECGHSEEIEMRMSEYTAEGHMCPDCGKEMQRDFSGLSKTRFVDTTGGFFKSFT